MKEWVVIPAFNEEKRLGPVLRQTKKYSKNILVVDDGSRDSTSTIAEKLGVHVLKLNQNHGKGFAMRMGCDFAFDHGANIVVCVDADGQHPSEFIPKLVDELKFKQLDVVFTWRARDKNMPFFRSLGNWSINFIMRFLFGKKQKDMLCGFMAFSSEAYKKLRWQSNRYGVETEITANCIINKLKWSEIPIPTIYLDRNKGVRFKDAFKIVLLMFKLKFRKVY